MGRTEGFTSLQQICLRCLAVYKHCLGEGLSDHAILQSGLFHTVPCTQIVQLHAKGMAWQCSCCCAQADTLLPAGDVGDIPVDVIWSVLKICNAEELATIEDATR